MGFNPLNFLWSLFPKNTIQKTNSSKPAESNSIMTNQHQTQLPDSDNSASSLKLSNQSTKEQQRQNQNQIKKPKDGHLFVLVHGLWGDASNMNVLEQILQDCVKDLHGTNEQVYSLKPRTFGYLKTYDGVKALGHHVIKEILFEIERLKLEENVTITKFSIVGYSLGGLIARYCLGELLECGFFNEIEPCIFTTFATPHLGVRFFKTERCWDRIANFLGTHFLGQSGRDLFIHNSDILPQLAERNSKYFKALTMFKKRILLANVN
ncbi:unnamed protein product [Ambrosiozyma monospora]|uniref:Unnamed protein product n=1 Tax=Ambrosiozyma monospora TaxID=43982 RepID=A0A9W6YX09_AMBMO|nr:unnamed protein product [Ambrosiozyma monospora]